MKKIISFIVISLICLISACNSPIPGEKFIIKPMTNDVNIKFEKTKAVSDNFVVIADPSKLSHTFGTMIKAQLPCLTDKDYNILQKDYIDKNKCPASFYNSNAKSVMILSDNINLDVPLKTIKDRDKITIEGYLLEIEGMYNKHNEKMHTQGRHMNKILFIQADKIIINGKMYL